MDELESAFQRNSITVTVEDLPWQIGRGKKPTVINLERLFSDHTYTSTDSTVINNYKSGSFLFLGKCEVTTLSVTNMPCREIMLFCHEKINMSGKNLCCSIPELKPGTKKVLKCQSGKPPELHDMTSLISSATCFATTKVHGKKSLIIFHSCGMERGFKHLTGAKTAK